MKKPKFFFGWRAETGAPSHSLHKVKRVQSRLSDEYRFNICKENRDILNRINMLSTEMLPKPSEARELDAAFIAASKYERKAIEAERKIDRAINKVLEKKDDYEGLKKENHDAMQGMSRKQKKLITKASLVFQDKARRETEIDNLEWASVMTNIEVKDEVKIAEGAVEVSALSKMGIKANRKALEESGKAFGGNEGSDDVISAHDAAIDEEDSRKRENEYDILRQARNLVDVFKEDHAGTVGFVEDFSSRSAKHKNMLHR